VFVAELDLGHLEAAAPVRLVPEAVLERPLRVLLAEVDVDRLGVAGLDERIQHGAEPRTAERVFGKRSTGGLAK